MRLPRQLALEFDHRPALSGEDFLVAPCNRDAVAWLDRWPDWPTPVLAIFGPPGCGKTHLAQVFRAISGARQIKPEDLAHDEPPRLIAGAPALLMDDAEDCLAAAHEEALLHLYNLLRETGVRMMMTACRPPARWTIGLADLASRLSAATAVGIGPPDDPLMAALLVKQFADRQLKVDGDIVSFMLARMERSFGAVRALVAAVDAAALAERRNITVPLVRRVMDRMDDQGEER